jgi:hypothetical protein
MTLRLSAHEEQQKSPPEPWGSFLKALNDILKAPVELHCIGGFAMTMQYGLSRTTSDIDVLPASPSERLAELQHLAGEGSELHRRFQVYLQVVAITNYPRRLRVTSHPHVA